MTARSSRIALAVSALLLTTPARPDDREAVTVRPAEAWQLRHFEKLRSHGAGGGLVGDIFTAQARYAVTHGENAVLVCWEETVDQGPGGLDLMVDGEIVSHVDALPAEWLPQCRCRLVSGLSEDGPLPGGDVDQDGTADEEELLHYFEVASAQAHLGLQVQKVRDAQFFGDAEQITCGFIGASCSDEEEECEIEVGGDGGAPPPTHFEFSVDSEPRLEVPGDVMAFADLSCYSFAVNTRGPHTVQLVSVVTRHDDTWRRSGVYLGTPVEIGCVTQCGEPRNFFVPGVFDGASGGPSIGSVIAGLNHLLGGGEPLPCLAAADANGDGEIDISDLVFVLLYLFSGGYHPFGWEDQDFDGTADMTCHSAPVEDCLESHPACE